MSTGNCSGWDCRSQETLQAVSVASDGTIAVYHPHRGYEICGCQSYYSAATGASQRDEEFYVSFVVDGTLNTRRIPPRLITDDAMADENDSGMFVRGNRVYVIGRYSHGYNGGGAFVSVDVTRLAR